jgi:hypothetical protein
VTERTLLRLAGSLILGGSILVQVVTAFHPSREDPNDHPAVFAEYADADAWEAVHFGQFAAALIVIAGLIVLYRALRASAAAPSVLGTLAFAAAIAPAAAVAALQAIDGIALKQAVDAWASAPGSEKAGAFQDAELVRWTEWGANSFFRLLQGATILLFGLLIARSPILPSWLGWLACVAGVGYMAVGIIVGYEGFSDAALHVVGAPADVLFFVVALGIAVVAWRRKETASRSGG